MRRTTRTPVLGFVCFSLAVSTCVTALPGSPLTETTSAEEPVTGDAAEQAPPCSSPEARQFDFWLGEWKLTWEDGHGTNHITAILDDCVIQEDFTGHMADGSVFRGKSVSSYNTRLGRWCQTWVDNAGGYLDFDGGLEDGKMIFVREAAHPEKPFLQRMVWYNITDDAIDWNWERSDDGGETWQVQWQIRYERQAQR